MDPIQLRRLAGIPVDLSKVANAKATVRTPARLISEAAKVPQHRGELAPKTKENMRARANHAKKALEALELARDELMDLPAVDYLEDIPDIIKQLHHMLHGDDGTGGMHALHRQYKHEFDQQVFPEDIEEDKLKQEEEAQKQKAGITGEEPEAKKTNESVGFVKQKVDPAKENKKPFKLAPDSLPIDKTMVADKKQSKEVGEDPADNTVTDDKVNEAILSEYTHAAHVSWETEVDDPEVGPKGTRFGVIHHTRSASDEEALGKAHKDYGHKPGFKIAKLERLKPKADEEDCAMSVPVGEGKETKKPKWLEKAEVKAEEKEGKKVSTKEKKKVEEGQGPLFARDASHPKQQSEERYSSWADGTKPVNVVSDDEPSLYYPNGSKRENANQLSTNPYNESQKVAVPAKIKAQLKAEADTARKLAETFTMRKDWDSKVFHETLANAFETLEQFLAKGTIYGIKEAQVFMTSLMSPFTNKIPADVIKYIAAGGTLRSLKSYVNDVKEPITGTVFQQDSDGLKGGINEAKNHLGERQFSTYSAWRAACKKAGAKEFEGNKDICHAKPGIGEWDGEKGVLY